MKKLFKRLFGKNLSCKIGFHNWKTVKSIKLSNLIFLVKKQNKVLNNVNLYIDFDYIVYDRTCQDCGVKDFNIKSVFNSLKDRMFKQLKNKN